MVIKIQEVLVYPDLVSMMSYIFAKQYTLSHDLILDLVVNSHDLLVVKVYGQVVIFQKMEKDLVYAICLDQMEKL
jgi:hypothetical protein